MLNYDFRTYIAEGTEFYGMLIKNLDSQEYQERKAAFPSSLLSFLDLDMESLAPLLKKISDELWSLTLTQDKRFAQEALSELAELEECHIYFSHLRLDWTWRISQALALGTFSENLLQRSALLRMAENLKQMQEQIRELFANILDMDRDQRPVMRKMADYYLRNGERAFRFRAYPLGFDLLPSGDFAEVLVPETVYDIIDYHVRECVKREVRMRVCKNCGRYFAVTGHGGVEYCDRVCDKKGRTCREVGAIMAWAKRRGEDDIFKAYRREYKKRFAWIKAGKIEPAAFYAWGEEARKRKDACEAGEISEGEFLEWLGNTTDF